MGKSQKIAIIDSGISPILNPDEKTTFSLIDDNVYDKNGHGTMMYSIIKGYKNDIIGISPETNVISIKILDEEESINPEIIHEAISLAINEGATIINLSIASYKDNSDIAQVIKKANSENITIVSSSGDYSDSEMMFPANMEEVISVGALGEDLSILDMTSGSDFTVINAPGENVKTLDVNGEVFHSSGTSQATAVISGYIALLKDYAYKNNKNLTNKDIEGYLREIKNNKIEYSDVFEKIRIKD